MTKSNTKNKVLILLPCFDLGGAEKQGLYIAKSMQESGLYEVEVWALIESSGLLIEKLKEAGLKYKTLNIPFSVFHNRYKRLLTYWSFLWELRSAKFDYIIPYTYHCNILCASVFRFAGIKKCLWFQIAMEYKIDYSTFEKIAKAFKPTYAANSNAAADFISKRHNVCRRKVEVIPNPFEVIPPKNDVPYWRDKLGVKEGDITLFMAANFFPEKDHFTVIKGIKLLIKYYPNIKLILAGGPLNSSTCHWLKSICYDLQMGDHVIFLGSIDDIAGILRSVTIGVLSSRSEGSPNSVIEYMGYGLPVIATNIPPISELFQPEYPYLFEVENVNDFVSKTDSLIKNIGNLSNHINRNKFFIESSYTIETNYQAFKKALNN